MSINIAKAKNEFFDICRGRYCPIRNGQCVADDCICFKISRENIVTSLNKYIQLTGHCCHGDMNIVIATAKFKED